MRLLMVAALLTIASSAMAQTARVFLEGGGTVSWQGAVDLEGDDSHDSGPGLGGTAMGVGVAVGAAMNGVARFSAEVSVPARFEAVRDFHHGIVQRTDYLYRDVVISALAHLGVPTGRSRAEIVGGVSFVGEDLMARFADGGTEFNPKPFGPYGSWLQRSAWTWGITTGCDVPIRLTSHVAIVPQLRVHIVPARPGIQGFGDLGLSMFVFRPAVGGRWTF